MTATADGLHCMNCTGDIVITGCVFEASHDDCMNINGRYLTVKSSEGTPRRLPGWMCRCSPAMCWRCTVRRICI